jgi:hydrogenase 3 maturation protease
MGAEQQFLEQLNRLRGSRTVIIGIGNPLKGDDGVGPLICERLRDAAVSAELIDAGTVPENYIQRVIKKEPRNLLIIDAVDFGASPGKMGIFKAEQLSSFAFSTHTLSPRLFIEMIAKEIEVDVYLVGIQPAQTRLGQSISAQVSRTVRSLVRALTKIFPPHHSGS